MLLSFRSRKKCGLFGERQNLNHILNKEMLVIYNCFDEEEKSLLRRIILNSRYLIKSVIVDIN